LVGILPPPIYNLVDCQANQNEHSDKNAHVDEGPHDDVEFFVQLFLEGLVGKSQVKGDFHGIFIIK